MTDQTQAIELAPEQGIRSTLEVIAQAARDPAVDVIKMHALLDLQERMLKLARAAAFNQAMARVQPKLPVIRQDGKIEFEKGGKTIVQRYAKYEDIDALIRPLLHEEGFSFSFDATVTDKLYTISCTLSHQSGHAKTISIPLPLDSTGSKNSVQAMGSTVSYGKRYLVCMHLNIITKGEDDDAHSLDPISEAQAKEIRELIRTSGASQIKFLEYVKANTVEEIKTRDYNKAIEALKRKAKQ